MTDMNYGLVVYGASSQIVLQLRDRVPNESTLKKIIDSASPNSGDSSLAKGLEVAKMLFDGTQRKDVRKILVVITDTETGNDKNTIRSLVDSLTNQNVHVIPVAIGDTARKDLNQDIDGEDVIVVSRDDRDKKIAEIIMKNVTSGK